jgi:hypothetical protein
MSPRASWLPALLALLALLACHGPDAATTPGPATITPPTPIAAPTPIIKPDPIDAKRRCGEPGRDPTDLPEALRTGLAPRGKGVLRPGDKQTHGTVVLEYDPDMMTSPSSIGHRGPALSMTIDRAEVPEHAPWGGFTELYPGREFHLIVGPYRVDARTSADNKELTYTIGHRGCPEFHVLEKTAHPFNLWLSSEAIRAVTHDMAGGMLQVTLEARGDHPRVDVSNLGYRQHFEPRPGEPRSFLVGAQRVTIDRVIPGPGTRFENDAWIADGDARVHVHVRVDPVAVTAPPPPVAPTSACGDASPMRTTLPAKLTALPPATHDATAALNAKTRLGPLTVTLTEETPPTRPHRDPETYRSLDISRGTTLVHRLSLGAWGATHLSRVGDDLLRVDLDLTKPPTARVRRFVLPCPANHDLPSSPDPVYVWLSTVGHRYVRVGAADTPPLSFTMHEDVARPSFAVTSPNAYFSSSMIAAYVGQVFTMDGYHIEVVDIVSSGDTRTNTYGWETSALAPAVHVQVRVAPDPDVSGRAE